MDAFINLLFSTLCVFYRIIYQRTKSAHLVARSSHLVPTGWASTKKVSYDCWDEPVVFVSRHLSVYHLQILLCPWVFLSNVGWSRPAYTQPAYFHIMCTYVMYVSHYWLEDFVCCCVGADIDTLCVAPRHVERADFFKSFLELMKNQPEVKELRVCMKYAWLPSLKGS